MTPGAIAIGLVYVGLVSLAGSIACLWLLNRPKTRQEFVAMFKFALLLTMISMAAILVLFSL